MKSFQQLSIAGPAAGRRGSVFSLMAVLLPVLAILAAFCINSAQMQLARTELIVATDAAARAGGRTFSESQSVSDAKEAARITAALNQVNGSPLLLQTNDGAGEMEFGITNQPGGDGTRYLFTKVPTSQVESGAGFASAFRVHGRRNAGSLSGKVNLVIPGIMGLDDFEANTSAVAMQVDRDISLVLDRSGSMDALDIQWPQGSSPWTWAALLAGVDEGLVEQVGTSSFRTTPGNDWNDYEKWAYADFHQLGPTPLTLWESLVGAVDAFVDVLDDTVQEEQVSVASYASSGSLDVYLQSDYDIVKEEIDTLNPTGMTAIGQGMQEGIETLIDSAARPFAAKTMVVMTDGIHNQGIRPDDVAATLASQYRLTIHTVTFGSGADQNLMRTVAEIGGGKHYHATTGAELVQIFREIANNLPTILVE